MFIGRNKIIASSERKMGKSRIGRTKKVLMFGKCIFAISSPLSEDARMIPIRWTRACALGKSFEGLGFLGNEQENSAMRDNSACLLPESIFGVQGNLSGEEL